MTLKDGRMMDDLVLRAMQPHEAQWAVQLAADEGWNPGLNDTGPFYQSDPAGFIIALLKGRPIGCISAVSYAGKFGFLGFYIVLPEYRGRGYGHLIWQAALEHLKGQVTGLDGVVEQLSTYAKIGFHLAYKSSRNEGNSSAMPAPDTRWIIDLNDLPFETVNQFDSPLFPADRRVFLRQWLKMPQSYALGCQESGKLKGYTVIRRCQKGWKVGPLLADSPAIAEKLLLNAVSKIDRDTPFFLDVVEPNQAAQNLVKKYKLQTVFVTGRMYNGPDPVIDLQRIFGVTSFELG
jgi:GNAT superfamily N-acetyltransferase